MRNATAAIQTMNGSSRIIKTTIAKAHSSGSSIYPITLLHWSSSSGRQFFVAALPSSPLIQQHPHLESLSSLGDNVSLSCYHPPSTTILSPHLKAVSSGRQFFVATLPSSPLVHQCPHLESHLFLGDDISLSCYHLPPSVTTLSPHSKAVFVGGNESLPRYCPVPLRQPSPHHILTQKLSPMDDNTPQQQYRSSPINDNSSPPAPHNSSPINNNTSLPLPPPPLHTFPMDGTISANGIASVNGIVSANGIVSIGGILSPVRHDTHTTGTPYHHTTTCTPASPLHQLTVPRCHVLATSLHAHPEVIFV